MNPAPADRLTDRRLDSGPIPLEPDLELRDRLQAALGPSYRLDRELGGGGMSRVFAAHEVELGRQVVIKVLPPEMSAGVNVDRFRREIQLAARLQHPHVVPLLTAGSRDDLIWYVMPFIEGESLRAKLAREGELPVAETVRILREVADALQYAHSNQVVHRDIKPDNVLITNKHAVVADFGVAKAVSASTGESSLTSLGVALGTPAYMAPEQAAADPHVDHRADIYALGAMAYEMLTGRPPFTGTNAQAVLAAHVMQVPDPITTHRASVPAGLAEIVMRCLAKKAADRWQRADELIPHLDALLTPTGGMTPTATQPLAAVDHEAAARKGNPVRVAALFGLAGVGVLAIVWTLVQQLGLPDWVFLGAIALLAVGLPIILVTGRQERRRALARAGAIQHTTPVGLQRHFTWRKAVLGGFAAFATLAVTAGGYAGLRAMGIGPFGTLVARGTLGERDRLILADFENATQDSTVAESVTELLRIDLSQSQVVSVLEPRAVGEVLARMRKERGSKITPDLAAEVAAREGLKAYIAGDVRGVGTGFVVSARVVDVTSGQVLVAGRETATGSGDLIAAVDRLSRHLRERIGESLRTIRADPPLEQLTTTSVDALRLYAQATRFIDRGDNDRAIALLEQTVAQDSTFAMAWRRIAVLYNNRGGFENVERAKQALARTQALRERLSDRERLHVEAYHAFVVERDFEKAVTAYLALVEKHPDDAAALNNLAVMYGNLARHEERDEIVRRTIGAGFAPSVTYTNYIMTRLSAGDLAEAESTLALLLQKVPDFTAAPQYRSNIALARRDFATSEAEARKLLTAAPALRQFANFRLGGLADIHGRMSEGTRLNEEGARIAAERSATSAEEFRLGSDLAEADRAIWLPNADPKALAQRYEALWRRQQVIAEGRPALQQNYVTFITAFARLDRPDRARALLAEYRGRLTPSEQEEANIRFGLEVADGDIARAEGRHQEAIRLFQASCEPFRKAFAECDASVDVAEAYDLAGQIDSAVAIYDRYLALEATRNAPERVWYPRSLRRAGQIHESKGNREKALEYYGKFVDLWKEADPSLQPLVRETRQWIAQLAGERK